jgi:hypothetical protein
MLQSGFDVSQLDQLIALEIKQEMCCQKLLEHRQNSNWHDEPMPSWEEKLHRQGITSDEVKVEWSNLSSEEQIAITVEEVRRVTWDKMAFVNGWMYRVIVQVDDLSKTKVTAGTVFRQVCHAVRSYLLRKSANTIYHKWSHQSRVLHYRQRRRTASRHHSAWMRKGRQLSQAWTRTGLWRSERRKSSSSA